MAGSETNARTRKDLISFMETPLGRLMPMAPIIARLRPACELSTPSQDAQLKGPTTHNVVSSHHGVNSASWLAPTFHTTAKSLSIAFRARRESPCMVRQGTLRAE